MIDIILSPIHTVIWLTSFIGILISLFFMYKYNRKIGYLIGPLTYFLDVFLYNCALYATYALGTSFLTLNQLEIWSGVVRLHSLFLFIAFIIFQPVRKR
jgi:hypothetical protein